MGNLDYFIIFKGSTFNENIFIAGKEYKTFNGMLELAIKRYWECLQSAIDWDKQYGQEPYKTQSIERLEVNSLQSIQIEQV